MLKLIFGIFTFFSLLIGNAEIFYTLIRKVGIKPVAIVSAVFIIYVVVLYLLKVKEEK